MSKINKIILLAAVALSQVVCLSGCSDTPESNNTKFAYKNSDGTYNTFDVKDDKIVVNAKKYLQSRYSSDSFEPAAGINLSNLEFSSSQYPGQNIHVTDSGDGKYEDNYMAVKYSSDVQNLFAQIAEKVYGTCRVMYEVNITPVDSSIAYSDYIADEKSHIHFVLLLKADCPSDDREAKLETLSNELRENKLACSASVYYTTSEESYNTVDINQNNYGWFSYEGVITPANGGETSEMKWIELP